MHSLRFFIVFLTALRLSVLGGPIIINGPVLPAPSGSAITFTNLVNDPDATNASSFATSSITPTANALVIAVVANSVSSGSPGTPSLSGCGLTWVAIGSPVTFDSGLKALQMFRAMGASPSSGAVTTSFGATQTSCNVTIVQFTNTNTGGTNGSAAIVQSPTSSISSGATTQTVTFSAYGGGGNHAAFVAFANRQTTFTGTAEAGWTEDYDGGSGTPVHGLYTMYQLNASDTTATVTQPSDVGAGFGIEITP